MEEELNNQPTTYKELRKAHKDIPSEEFNKIILVCGNCGHKDLLVNFLKERENQMSGVLSGQVVADRIRQTNKIMMVDTLDSFNHSKDLFYCPKCKSSLVLLDKDYTKQNMVKLI